jgi:hypothetical protein
MCGKDQGGGFGLKIISTFAGFCALTGVFTAAAPPAATAQALSNPNIRHLFRQTIIPGADGGAARIGLWILNPTNGRVRLCLLEDTATHKQDFLKCSKWLGGDGPQGRYVLMDVRRRLPYRFRRALTPGQPGTVGVWILEYHSGAARACVATDVNDPTGSLTCAKAP